MNVGNKVLIAPLNWGLGHATRCIPITNKLIADGHEIIIVSDGHPLCLLKKEFPDEFPNLTYIELPSYNIRYSRRGSQVFAMLYNLPKILYGIYREHFFLKKIIKQHQVSTVISDNRFGLWSKKIQSIYITHQLMIKAPSNLKFLEPILWAIHRFFISKYNECWIPDYEGEDNLSGDLSHKYPLPKNTKFINPLSRFYGIDIKDIDTKKDVFDIVVIISGPEPQRTIFEKQMVEKYFNSEDKTLIIQGLPKDTNHCTHENSENKNLYILPHLDTKNLAVCLINAHKIVCRSGYSTIMDLHALDCLHKAELIPTPGQTEQEYLAYYHQLKRELNNQPPHVN